MEEKNRKCYYFVFLIMQKDVLQHTIGYILEKNINNKTFFYKDISFNKT